ncbi:MAG: hypothetical protein CL510_02485 [Actinobacteria bacterium]|nr:hypothetical protein [Actinomycetota bacterium]
MAASRDAAADIPLPPPKKSVPRLETFRPSRAVYLSTSRTRTFLHFDARSLAMPVSLTRIAALILATGVSSLLLSAASA